MNPRMGSLAAVALLASLLACGHDGTTAPRPTPARAVEPPRPSRPSLLLEARDAASRTATYVALALEDGSPRLGARATRPLLGITSEGVPYTLAAHHEGRLARVERDGDVHALVVEGTAREAARLPLGGEAPAAMLRTETGLFVGIGTKVVYVDLERTPLRAETLVERPPSHGKAYDVFARAGDRVVAIDDVVRPIYADYFALAEHGRPRHLAGWDMPGLINGRYQHAALVKTGEDTHSLFVAAAYGVLDGNGHVIASIPVVGDALGVGDGLLNAGGNLPWAVSEHASRVNDEPSRLFDGTELTPLTGLVHAHGHVLVAAQQRGLFVFPQTLGASPIVLGSGSVHDVAVLEGRVFVLAASGQRAVLMELTFRADGPAFTWSLFLDEPYRHFVD